MPHAHHRRGTSPRTGGANIDPLKYRAERAVIGGCLRTPGIIPETLTNATPDDFGNAVYRGFFDALVAGYNAGKVTDEISGSNWVMEQGLLGNSALLDAWGDIIREAPLPATVPGHAQHVRENAIRRRLEQAEQKFHDAHREGRSLSELRQYAQELVDAGEDDAATDARRIGDTLDQLLDEISARGDGEMPDFIPTGFRDLDELLNGGLKPGQMVIVAARPGVGKSTLALDIMREMSIRRGEPSLLFSLEMTEDEVQERALSAESQVKIGCVKSGNMSEQEWGRVAAARDTLTEAPLWVDDNPELTMVDITAKAKLAVRHHGVRLIAIDYLQLLKSGAKEESRQQEVSSFSRQIKLLAKSCQVPVIAIAQLNRGVEQRGDDATPKPSDLRESGSLEQDADLVMLINRPDAQNKDHERAGEADIIVAKNRGGATGTVTVANQLHYSRFTPM